MIHLSIVKIGALGVLLLGGFAAFVFRGEPVQTEPGGATRTFQVQGFVREVDAVDGTATIEHEDIPGFMAAMTMPFYVKDPVDLAKLKAGDPIGFELVVTENDSWICKVERVSAREIHIPESVGVSETPDARSERVREGDKLPPFNLVDQNGSALSKNDYSGKYLLFTFIFTRCPIPNFCPRLSNHFSQIENKLATDPDLADRVRLLSISFDPEFDTQKVLQAYAKRFAQDSEKWKFATGSLEEVAKLTQAFAVYVKPEKGTLSHGLCTVLVDGNGVIRNIWRGNEWKPDEVLAELRTAATLQGNQNTDLRFP